MPRLWLAINILPGDDRHRICPYNLQTPFRLGTVMKFARLFFICGVDPGLIGPLVANARLSSEVPAG
jgi:hypothetical protein